MKLKNQELLLVQFPDDLGLVLQYKQRCWDENLYVFDCFQRMSGMLINYDKSVVYRGGSLRNSDAKFYSNHKLFWTKNPFNVSSVYLSTDADEMYQYNMLPLLEKAKAVTNLWVNRNLSLIGKILIPNSLVASLFVYQMMIHGLFPKKYLKQINDIYLTSI